MTPHETRSTTMPRRSIRRTVAALVTAGIAAGLVAASLGGPASAGVPSRTRSQIATPPPPGSGVVIIVQQPQPVGPRSLT